MAEKDVENVDIDANGDVIFVCPYGLKTTRRYRVLSTIVSQASPVFKAMLSTHFKEGSTLLKNSCVEIELPDDDAWVMDLIFNIMHFKNDRVSKHCSPVGRLEIAETVDKYQCAGAIAPMLYYFMAEDVPNASQADLLDFLRFSYVLDQHEHFERICRKLILESRAPIRSDSIDMLELHGALAPASQEWILANDFNSCFRRRASQDTHVPIDFRTTRRTRLMQDEAQT